MMAGGGAFLAQAAPSDRIVMGVIGSGGRGTFVMTVFQKDQAVSVGAICDVYERTLPVEVLSQGVRSFGTSGDA